MIALKHDPLQQPIWDLDFYLEEGETAPDGGESWFHVGDVIRVHDEQGRDVPGTLREVADLIVFQPADELAPGGYKYVVAEYKGAIDLDFSYAFEFTAVEASGALPRFGASVKQEEIGAEYVSCETLSEGDCGLPLVATRLLTVARIDVWLTASASALGTQYAAVAETAGQRTITGFGRSDTLWRATSLSGPVVVTAEIFDLRTGEKVQTESVELTYEGTFADVERTLESDDFDDAGCIAPPDGYAAQWCEVYGPRCADASDAVRDEICANLDCPGIDTPGDGADGSDDAGTEDGRSDAGPDEPVNANQPKSGCSVATSGTTGPALALCVLSCLGVLRRKRLRARR